MQTVNQVMRTMRPGFFARTFKTSAVQASRWNVGPSPPRLPKEEQEIFEKLQQQSTGAFSTPRQINPEATESAASMQTAESSTTDAPQVESSGSEREKILELLRERARVVAKGDGEELHPNVRRGALPEFEGEINPKTGEVGGPKNEPLRWGVTGDWSYNGRCTDF
jgi:hypothetical protein